MRKKVEYLVEGKHFCVSMVMEKEILTEQKQSMRNKDFVFQLHKGSTPQHKIDKREIEYKTRGDNIYNFFLLSFLR